MPKLSPSEWRPTSSYQLTDKVDSILKETNENIIVIAGPGAGKTEILAQRANYLLQTGLCRSPQKILALSFKVDAASNIKNRVEKRCGKYISNRFDSFTFDAFFQSIARRFSRLLPDCIDFKGDFELVELDKNWWQSYELKKMEGRPTAIKKQYSPNNLIDLSSNTDLLEFWSYCSKINIADFNMCRSMAFSIIKNNPSIRNLLRLTYKYLFLDEFQDSTNLQYEFIKEVFCGTKTIITAIGDSNQMIMGWAGASSENFNKFQKDFSAQINPLEINYRSNSKIVTLINHVLSELTPLDSPLPIYNCAKSNTISKLCIGARSFATRTEEGRYIAKYIKTILRDDINLSASDCVLILRQKADDYYTNVVAHFKAEGLSLRNEDTLIGNGIKLQELMAEPLSNILLLLIKKKSGKINYQQDKELEYIISSIYGYDLNVNRDIRRLKECISSLIKAIDFSKKTDTWVSAIIKELGPARLENNFTHYKSKYLNKVLASFISLFEDSWAKGLGIIEKAIANYEGTNQVKLMTIHKSKGLEFDTVFFVDFHQESWWALDNAHRYSKNSDITAELNTFFVGLSRAKERLFFTRSSEEFFSKSLNKSVQKSWPPVIKQILSTSKLLHKLPDLL
jgi:superfamily I DNA/RNA helicase